MKFAVPGFPEQVSAKIEMPDIAELLMQPMFYRADEDVFMKNATEFQKKLFYTCKFKGTKKKIVVYSGVQVFDQYKRLFTRPNPLGREWHMDGYGGRIPPWEESDIVHYLLGHSQTVTEFNKNAMEFDIPDNWNRFQFSDYLNTDPVYNTIIPQPIELGRIYTFDNHIHRPVPSKGIEFRFTFRVTETDWVERTLPLEEQMPSVMRLIDGIAGMEKTPNIIIEPDGIKIVRIPIR